MRRPTARVSPLRKELVYRIAHPRVAEDVVFPPGVAFWDEHGGSRLCDCGDPDFQHLDGVCGAALCECRDALYPEDRHPRLMERVWSGVRRARRGER